MTANTNTNTPQEKNYFEILNGINVNKHTETKNGLTFLSWAWAWAEVKKVDPTASYKIYENADGLCYHHDGNTAWVKTGVTVGGIEHIEYLPIMDYRNNSIPVAKITSFDVNKAVQRSITKAIARHGLGLYLYYGGCAPEAETEQTQQAEPPKQVYTSEDAGAIFDSIILGGMTKAELIDTIKANAAIKGISEEDICTLSKKDVKALKDMDKTQLEKCLDWINKQ